MKKPIKIVPANAAAITAALAAANGKADAHTITTYAEIERIAEKFEARLLGLVGAKDRAAGAFVLYTSGDKLPNAYKYSRIVTSVRLERRSSAWWLVSVSSHPGYNSAGPESLHLTPEQDEAACAVLRRQYSIIKPVVAEVAA